MLIVSGECSLQLRCEEISDISVLSSCSNDESTINIYTDLITNHSTYLKVLVFDDEECKKIYNDLLDAVIEEIRTGEAKVLDFRAHVHCGEEKCASGPELYYQHKS